MLQEGQTRTGGRRGSELDGWVAAIALPAIETPCCALKFSFESVNVIELEDRCEGLKDRACPVDRRARLLSGYVPNSHNFRNSDHERKARKDSKIALLKGAYLDEFCLERNMHTLQKIGDRKSIRIFALSVLYSKQQESYCGFS